MAGKKGNKNHANETSYPNQKNNRKDPRIIYRKFAEIYQNVINDNGEFITSWQKACLSIGWRVTKMDYWSEKIPIFGTYKKEIQEVIISIINHKALNNKYNPAISIWRMKMLGEKDTQYQNIDQKTEITNKGLNITVSNQQDADQIKKIKNDLENAGK